MAMGMTSENLGLTANGFNSTSTTNEYTSTTESIKGIKQNVIILTILEILRVDS